MKTVITIRFFKSKIAFDFLSFHDFAHFRKQLTLFMTSFILDGWTKRYAGSKTKSYPDFGTVYCIFNLLKWNVSKNWNAWNFPSWSALMHSPNFSISMSAIDLHFNASTSFWPPFACKIRFENFTIFFKSFLWTNFCNSVKSWGRVSWDSGTDGAILKNKRSVMVKLETKLTWKHKF